MTIEAITIINRVAAELTDEDHARWSVAKLLDYLNVAQARCVQLNDRVNPIRESLHLVAGVKQTLPTGAIKLINVPYNLGSDGTTRGKSINRVPRSVINKRLPDWPNATASGVVGCYIQDDDFSSFFEVYPPQPATNTHYVEVHYSKRPDVIANSNAGTLITIDDQWERALFYCMCATAMSNESDIPNSKQQAANYEQQFLMALGLTGNDQVAKKEQQ